MIEKFIDNLEEELDSETYPRSRKFGVIFASILCLLLGFVVVGCTGGGVASNTPPVNVPKPDTSTELAETPGNAPLDVDAGDIMVEPGAKNLDEKDAKAKDKDDLTAKEGAEDDVDLIADKNEKMVSLNVEVTGRANPFLPAGEEAGDSAKNSQKLIELQKAKLQYDLIDPPNSAQMDSEAQKILTTTVSGIMYDQNSPSAILNIEGSDFLVRSGDVVNGYKVLAISPSVVTVQLGENVYKAGVGQLLATDGINYNTVPNLSKKFGGAKNK